MRYSLMPSAQRAPHYGVLLAVSLILVTVRPLLPAGWATEYVVEFSFDLVLITGAYSAASQSKHRAPFLALTAATLVLRWTDMAWAHTDFSVPSIALAILWLVYAVVLVVAALFRTKRVDTNMILAAIVAYLLAAVAFAQVFLLIEIFEPGSFRGLPTGGTQHDVEHALMYFSFVSITTMGYGDLVPVSELARSCSSLTGMFGTLYLAVMIARLVGLHSAAPADVETSPPPSG